MQKSEVLYTAEQIRIPPEFPDVLKNYTKNVLKDQPADIFLYSIEYFNRLQKSRPTNRKLTESQLAALFQKFHRLAGEQPFIARTDILSVYEIVGASTEHVDEVLQSGGFEDEQIPWLKLWALSIASGFPDLPTILTVAQKIIQKEYKNYIDLTLEVFQFLVSRDSAWSIEKTEKVTTLVKSLNDGRTDISLGKIVKDYC